MTLSLRRLFAASLLALAGTATAFAPPWMGLRPDGSAVLLLVPGPEDCTLVSLSTADGSESRPAVRLSVPNIQAATVGGDTGRITYALADGRIRMVDPATGREKDLLTRVPGARKLRFSPSETLLAVATERHVLLLETEHGTTKEDYGLDEGGVEDFCLRDGVLLVGTTRGSLRFHNCDSSSVVREMPSGGRAGVTTVHIESADFAAAGYADGTIRLVDPKLGIELEKWRMPQGPPPTAVAFWPAAKWVIVASQGEPVTLFDAVSGTPLGQFPRETVGAMDVDGSVGGNVAALYPDGRLLIMDARLRSIKARYLAKLPAGATVPGRP